MTKAREIAELGDAVTVDGSNVGIGTSSPSASIHAYHATTNVVGTFESGDADVYITLADNTTTSDTAMRIGVTGNDMHFSTSATERIRITSDGSVGIGTSSPTSLGTGITTLELKGNSASQADRAGGIRFERYDGTYAGAVYNADGAFYHDAGAYPMLFYTNSSERMRIDSDGDISVSGQITGGQLSYTNVATLSDDSVYVLDPVNSIGIVMFNGRNDNYDYIHGIVSYRTSANTYATQMGVGDANVLVGEFSGVPGVSNVSNGYFSVVVSDNGNIYFWNRLGSAVSFGITLLGS